MEFGDGFVSPENQELLKWATESVDPVSVTPPVIASPRSPHTPRGKKSPRGSPGKNDRHSHSGRDGRPKKGGSGGKGTWGGILDTEGDYRFDRNDPNYESNEDTCQDSPRVSSAEFIHFKRQATSIVEEYLSTDDVTTTAHELRELGSPTLHYYFVKKLVSMAMDRHDREKEMAAVLLSSLYNEGIDSGQLYKGFCELTASSDDLSVDTPDAVDILAVFVARAGVDDILPPAFLAKQMACLLDESKGAEVLRRAEKSYLSVPHHAEIILQRWGGCKSITVEEAKCKISDILDEYLAGGDRGEACRCIRDLKIPFFHHDIVKRALTLAMERRGGVAEGLVLDLFKAASEEGVINESQMTKGFSRLVDTVDDLALDVPNARCLLRSMILKASSEGWLCASSLKPVSSERPRAAQDENALRLFKATASSIIKEYFLTGDIIELVTRFESENHSCSSSLNAAFVKKLITSAMDRKNREKEMASVLLPSLCLPSEDVVSGFQLLIDSAEDTALDNPAIVEDLAMFLARSVVDEVIAPSDLEAMQVDNSSDKTGSAGVLALRNARALLGAKLSAERILRCWGGGGSNKTRWELEEVKDKIGKLLQEYDCGGDLREACRCIKDLGMPFFHHEVVKKALVTIMEKRKDERLWALLEDCYGRGLITPNQMTKGFERVADCVDDLALDVPDAEEQFSRIVQGAKKAGWLDASVLDARSGQLVGNGFVLDFINYYR